MHGSRPDDSTLFELFSNATAMPYLLWGLRKIVDWIIESQYRPSSSPIAGAPPSPHSYVDHERSCVKLLFSATVSGLQFFRGQLSWIRTKGHEIHVVSSPSAELEGLAQSEGVKTHSIPMRREIAVGRDATALIRWVVTLRRVRPDVVIVSTPKAGLLGGLAAALVQIPRRVYILRGARFEGVPGAQGRLLRGIEQLACATAHQVIAVSPSLARLVIDLGVASAEKTVIVGSGSSNGVDLERFRLPTRQERDRARDRWGLGPEDAAVCFVGRLSADKGLDLLAEALATMPAVGSQVVVLLAGTDEGATFDIVETRWLRVRRLGHVTDVPALLHAADVLALPTRREGFPNVVLEASACGLPVVTTDATGAVDSVIDGATGFVVGRRDARAFGAALARLVDDSALRERMGAAGRRRVEAEFDRETVWQGMYRAYLGLGRP